MIFFLMSRNMSIHLKLTLMSNGWEKDGTASSIKGCALTKFTETSGNVRLSFTHTPGLGCGT